MRVCALELRPLGLGLQSRYWKASSVDARAGATAADRVFANLVRRSGKPAILVAYHPDAEAILKGPARQDLAQLAADKAVRKSNCVNGELKNKPFLSA